MDREALRKLLKPVFRSQFSQPADLVPYGALLTAPGPEPRGPGRPEPGDQGGQRRSVVATLPVTWHWCTRTRDRRWSARGWLDEARRRYHTSKAGQPAFARNALLWHKRMEWDLLANQLVASGLAVSGSIQRCGRIATSPQPPQGPPHEPAAPARDNPFPCWHCELVGDWHA